MKTNLGHTEGAAGVAGLIKTVLALQHRQIPASLHLVELNPEIPWSDLPLYIPRQLTPFPSSSRPLIAGVSSFGIAGTNAHVVMEEAPRHGHKVMPEILDWNLLTLSAKTDEALKAAAHAYSQFLTEEGSPATKGCLLHCQKSPNPSRTPPGAGESKTGLKQRPSWSPSPKGSPLQSSSKPKRAFPAKPKLLSFFLGRAPNGWGWDARLNERPAGFP